MLSALPVQLLASAEGAEVNTWGDLTSMESPEDSIVVDVTTTAEPTSHVVKTYGAGAPVSPLTGPDGTTNPPSSFHRLMTHPLFI